MAIFYLKGNWLRGKSFSFNCKFAFKFNFNFNVKGIRYAHWAAAQTAQRRRRRASFGILRLVQIEQCRALGCSSFQ